MRSFTICIALCLLQTCVVRAAISASMDYTTTQEFLDAGGRPTASSDYECQSAIGLTGGLASSADYSLRGGFAEPEAVSAPEIALSGNGMDIANGEVTPGTADHTDFGSTAVAGGTVVRTFTISNSGTAALNITGTPKVVVSGAHAADFTVTLDPTTPVVASSGTTTFQVTFDPSASGPRTATLSIANDDADEKPFTFAIAGTGLSAQESWRQQYFGTTSNTGNAADTFDFDQDGLPNLLEWAAGLIPTTSSFLSTPMARNGSTLEFIYTRSIAAVNAGAGFTVEWSDDLPALSWSSAGVTQTEITNNGPLQQMKATLPAGSLGRRFVRLRVTAPPS